MSNPSDDLSKYGEVVDLALVSLEHYGECILKAFSEGEMTFSSASKAYWLMLDCYKNTSVECDIDVAKRDLLYKAMDYLCTTQPKPRSAQAKRYRAGSLPPSVRMEVPIRVQIALMSHPHLNLNSKDRDCAENSVFTYVANEFEQAGFPATTHDVVKNAYYKYKEHPHVLFRLTIHNQIVDALRDSAWAGN